MWPPTCTPPSLASRVGVAAHMRCAQDRGPASVVRMRGLARSCDYSVAVSESTYSWFSLIQVATTSG